MYEHKKIFIFDLDNTLVLHDAQEPYKSEYHSKIISYLKDLKNKDKLVCLVTYNPYPKVILNDLIHLFDYIYSPELIPFAEYIFSNKDDEVRFKNCTPWRCGDNISLCKDKSIVIKDILSQFNCKYYQAIFFDDNPNHIKSVRDIGIESILVNPLKGIYFNIISESWS